MANKKEVIENVEAEVIDKNQMPAEPTVKVGFLQKLSDKKKLAVLEETAYQSDLASKYANGEISTLKYQMTKMGHGFKKNGKKLIVGGLAVGGLAIAAAKAATGQIDDTSDYKEISSDECQE